MSVVKDLEKSLVDPLDKKAPVKLPVNARKSVARSLWVVALVVGVLQLWAAWSLWHLGHYADRVVDYVNKFASYYGAPTVDSHLGLFYYVALLLIAAEGVVMLLAAPQLKAMRKSGWNLLFYSMLLNVVYGVVRMFSDVGGGFGQLVMAAVGAVVGAWLLFQVRDQFMGKSVEHKTEAK